MPPQRKSSHIGAMFDIRPVTDSGHVDVGKLSHLTRVVDLNRRVKKSEPLFVPGLVVEKKKVVKKASLPKLVIPAPRPVIDKGQIHQEVESLLNNGSDLVIELARFGGFVEPSRIVSIRPRAPIARSLPASKVVDQPVASVAFEDGSHEVALKEIYMAPRDYALPEVEVAEAPALMFAEDGTLIAEPAYETQIYDWLKKPDENQGINFRFPKISFKALVVSIGIVLAAVALAKYGIYIKERLVQNGASAVENLEMAEMDIKNFNFEGASHNFTAAYEEFSKAGETMNFMGSTIGGFIGDLPGGGTLRSAHNLIEVGKLLADAGAAMTEAFSSLSKTSLLVNPTASSDISVGQLLSSLKKALAVSSTNAQKANSLMAKIDLGAVPEDRREALEEFKAKLPSLTKILSDGVEYSKFLEGFVDVKGSKRYLVLFQNPSELRPTGGFAGTYGVLDFKDGRLQAFKVDDIYNPDGQLKERIVPPKELQHITPTLGMRDISWFIDFPTSARKVITYFKKGTNQDVDGVIAVSPKIVSRILEIVGPVAMPDYGVTLTSRNFLMEIQEEVEYGKNRDQPKQIVVDMAPKLLEKMYSADSDQWLSIFNAFVAGLEKKDVMVYSRNLALQSFAVQRGFGGQVARTDSDYFMATFTNVKGSKTDVVTENAIKIGAQWEGNQVRHTVTLTRTHKGGNHALGFYNKTNPAYVRVLVPEGSKLVSITGHDVPVYRPLIDYTDEGFEKDEDLARFELEASDTQFNGVKEYKESGKTEYGFWLITDPGKTKSVTFEYLVPKEYSEKNYRLYVQKQPGLEVNSFDFTLRPPINLSVKEASSFLGQIGDVVSYSASLESDLDIKVKME